MGFLSSLKRLFFATESVTKSTIQKGVEYSKEKTHEVIQDGKEAMHTLEEKTAGLRESISHKAEEWKEKAEDIAEKAEDFVENAGEKLAETGKKAWEKVGDMAEKAEDMAEKAGEKLAETGKQAWETMENLAEKAGTKFESVKEEINNQDNPVPPSSGIMSQENATTNTTTEGGDEKTFTESLGEKVMETGNQLFEKTSDIAEKMTEKVVETSNQVWEKTSEIAEKVGEKVKEGGENLWEKTKEIGSKIEEKFEETLEKAKKAEEEDALKPKGEFSDKPMDTSGSLLEKNDDFFNKAAQYAEGHYDSFSEGKVVINTENATDQPNKESGDKDIDGLIDDAIVVKE